MNANLNQLPQPMLDFDNFLIKSDIQTHLRSTTTFDLEEILPHAQTACETYMYKFLSPEFVEEIISGDETNETVKELTKTAIICFAGAIYADIGSINISSSGMQEVGDAEAKPVRLEVLRNFQLSNLKSGHTKLELLLQYLEKNADDFETWKDSDAYTLMTETPVKSLSDFQSYIYLHDSRQAFIALKPYLRQVYEVDLEDRLEKISTLELDTPKTKKVNNIINLILCNQAYALGINDFSIILRDSTYSFDNKTANRQSGSFISAEQSKIEANASQKLGIANAYYDKLDRLIESFQNVSPASPFENDCDSKVYFAG